MFCFVSYEALLKTLYFLVLMKLILIFQVFKKLKINVSVIPENEFATLPHWLVWKTYTLIMLL